MYKAVYSILSSCCGMDLCVCCSRWEGLSESFQNSTCCLDLLCCSCLVFIDPNNIMNLNRTKEQHCFYRRQRFHMLSHTYDDTLQNNLGIKNDSIRYLKENC